MKGALEALMTRRGLTRALSGLTLIGATIYNLFVHRYNPGLAIGLAILSALLAYAFFWYVLGRTSLPD
jgi:hypothetical protein